MSVTAIDEFIDLMNRYGTEKEPFLFIIDFDMHHPEIHKLNSVPCEIKFDTPLTGNPPKPQIYTKPVSLKKHPLTYSKYSDIFSKVMDNIRLGNSYLLNLTCRTPVESDFTLEEIYHSCHAKYKLLYHDDFVVFSPEIFVRIENGIIRSFPMKGTIDSSIPDAEQIILNDEKEEAEHNTIVDLIRNDLSKVANHVSVTRYRYIETINTGNSRLLQVSSEISGHLNAGYEKHLGDIITGLLPAGSVSGAPKMETVRIIREAENYERGWYTGVFGVFDGTTLDSGVMIRFIEKESDKLYFKSGGGITYLSDPLKEYEEMISKIYVPAG